MSRNRPAPSRPVAWFWRHICVCLCVCLALLLPLSARAGSLTVFAAASMTNAMQDIGTLWQAAGHQPIRFSFASSSTLAEQIEHGAPANLFISADEKWMNALAEHHDILPATRADLAGNALVVVEPKTSLKPIHFGPAGTLPAGTLPNSTLAAALGATGRLAVGNPAHVPAGIYAKQALQKLGLWPALQSRLAPADSVRSALRLVELGEAPAGIVYATDVRITPSLAIAGTFPADSHDPILYPAAIVRAGATKEARAFLAFLHTQAAGDVFRHYGFLVP